MFNKFPRLGESRWRRGWLLVDEPHVGGHVAQPKTLKDLLLRLAVNGLAYDLMQ